MAIFMFFSNLSKLLTDHGHSVVLISRGFAKRNPTVHQQQRTKSRSIGTSEENLLAEAFAGCDAVAHCAGINRELTPGDFDRIHVQGTRNVVNAAKTAGVKKLVLVSFYGARPDCARIKICSGRNPAQFRSQLFSFQKPA